MKVEPVQLAFTAAPEPDALMAAARTNNFEILMRQAELAQQGFKVSLAHKDRKPSFTVGPYLSREDARDHERQVGIGLSVPLPLWNRNEGNIETARRGSSRRRPQCTSRSGPSRGKSSSKH